jgi:molecular chaperone HtpG
MPVQVHALLFVPSKTERFILSIRKEEGLKLYARKVLIQEYCKELLPDYMRFIQGVVDSEDLPLNVSRENIQSNQLIGKLRKVITGRLISALKEFSIKNPEDYKKFWEEFGKFIKEGVATTQDSQERESLYPLLRFKTSKFYNQWNSLNEVISRLKAGQKSIYYLLGDDVDVMRFSPHLEYFNKEGFEVLLLSDPIDSFMLMGLNSYEGFPLENCATSKVSPLEEKEDQKGETTAAEKERNTAILQYIKDRLKDKVVDVRASDRLVESIARLTDPEGSIGQEWQRVYRYLGRSVEAPKKVLEVNLSHPIIKYLDNYQTKPDLYNTIIDLIYENALLMEGLHPNPPMIIPMIEKVMLSALANKEKESE